MSNNANEGRTDTMSAINYLVRDEMGVSEEFAANDDAAAKAFAEEWIAGGYSDTERSVSVTGILYVETTEDLSDMHTGEHHWAEVCSVERTIEPREPKCTGSAHDWQSPHEIVGGLAENPGVWGNGGGVKTLEVCMVCGCSKNTDTYASNGRGGHMTSVSYEAKEYLEQLNHFEVYDVRLDGAEGVEEEHVQYTVRTARGEQECIEWRNGGKLEQSDTHMRANEVESLATIFGRRSDVPDGDILDEVQKQLSAIMMDVA